MPVRTIGAVSASVIAFPMFAAAAAPASAATIPYPKPSRTLPAALDVAAFYQEGTRCLTENQPGAVAFAKLLNATYGTHTYGILRKCAAEHGEGRALDWMIDSRKAENLALANALTRWLAAPDAKGRPGAMARRFGINYIIFNRQQWKAWAPERGWTAYYGVSPHTDHIHFSFNWDGAYKRTSWWSGVAVTKPLTGPTGSTAPAPTTPVITAAATPSSSRAPAVPTSSSRRRSSASRSTAGSGRITAAALGTWQAQARRAGDQEARQRDLGDDGLPQAGPGPHRPALAVHERRAPARLDRLGRQGAAEGRSASSSSTAPTAPPPRRGSRSSRSRRA